MSKPRRKPLTEAERETFIKSVRAMLQSQRDAEQLIAIIETLLDEHAERTALLERIHGRGGNLLDWRGAIEALGIGKKAPTLEEFTLLDQAIPGMRVSGDDFASYTSLDGKKLARVTVENSQLTVAVAVLNSGEQHTRLPYGFNDAPSAVEFVSEFLGVE